MKVNLTTETLEDANFIYDLLVTPTSGCGCLKGEKQCLNSLESLPDVMVFDLTEEEIEELSKHEKIKEIHRHNNKYGPSYTKKGQTGRPTLAKYNSSNESVSHSLYYCQNYALKYNHTSPTDGSSSITLSTIDCSNVDVVIFDSGIDVTHPEFIDENGNSNIVQFNWTLLKSGDPSTGTQIVATQSADYYKDVDGHGTCCASLIAGKRNGFAKNAKIYSLRENDWGDNTDGFSTNTCMELMLAFQKAKKLNLHGLDSSRPTIFSNSWRVGEITLEDTLVGTTQNAKNYAHSFDGGKQSDGYNKCIGRDTVIESYMRNILNEGVHVVIAAGNNNTFLENSINNRVFVHYFNDENGIYAIPRTRENNNSYTQGNTYNGLEYGDGGGWYTGWIDTYCSPNIGLNYSKDDYPAIIVGDITMVGDYGANSDHFYSGSNGKTAYNILKDIASEDKLVTDKTTVMYGSLAEPFFIKTSYSNYGPEVDIYAPGNGAWAALSNQVTSPVEPTITVDGNNSNKHKFFNGTSSATPIVAGILATYLAEFPAKTPKQAREWLLQNAVRGGILESDGGNTVWVPVSSFDNNTDFEINVPFGPEYNNLRSDSVSRLCQGDATLYGTGDIHDVLFCNRFIMSNNLIAQAYPLRYAVTYSKITSIINFADTTLYKNKSTTLEMKTHDISLTWPNF